MDASIAPQNVLPIAGIFEVYGTKNGQDGPSVDAHIGRIAKPPIVQPLDIASGKMIALGPHYAALFRQMLHRSVFVAYGKLQARFFDVFYQVHSAAVDRLIIVQRARSIPVDDHALTPASFMSKT